MLLFSVFIEVTNGHAKAMPYVLSFILLLHYYTNK